jgi:hypothetical protein
LFWQEFTRLGLQQQRLFFSPPAKGKSTDPNFKQGLRTDSFGLAGFEKHY